MAESKLVRDRIPEIIKKKGGRPVTHIAKKDEYWQKLKEKLEEEIEEFAEEPTEEELADILEVIDAIIDFRKIDRSKLRKIKADKAKKRGKFAKKIILDDVK